MSIYQDHILPRGINKVMAGKAFGRLRRKILQHAAGTVLEIGFGSGLNLPYYPDNVEALFALDPATLGRRLAASRIAACPFPIHFIELEGDHIRLGDASVDQVVSTWTLCTVPSPQETLREITRVLKPGGKLLFIEHGLSQEPHIARWQHRLEPLQKCFAGGCHLTREIDRLIDESGLESDRLERFYMDGPKIQSAIYMGFARKPV